MSVKLFMAYLRALMPSLLPAALPEQPQDRFEGDDGSLTYAKAAGIYTEKMEAPLFEDRVLPPHDRSSSPTLVILSFGQSNAANSGIGCYAACDAVRVFNFLDLKYYRAADPLPGATNDGASVWGRLGDKLIRRKICQSVVLVPIAFGGTFITDWTPGGNCHRRLLFALHRLAMAGLPVSVLCWHQGEADANLTAMSASTYKAHFLSIVAAIRRAKLYAPIFVAAASLCETGPHPFKNREQIRLAQKRLVSIQRGILPGPDTDTISVADRADGCHFSSSGLELHAQLWLQSLTASRAHQWATMARYRLGLTT